MGAVDESLGEVQLAAIVQVFRQAMKEALEHAVFNPLLEPSVARRWRRIATRKIGPRCAGPKHPQHTVHHVARIAPRSTTLGARTLPLLAREDAFDGVPLLIGEVHPHV